MKDRDTLPADVFDLLKRLLNCNWAQLAARLGVTPQTLKRWRTDGLGANGAEKCQLLMHSIMMASNTDWLLLQTNWSNVRTIGGKR